MAKYDPGHWILCGDTLEPQFVRPKDGRVICPLCGQMFPLHLEGLADTEPAADLDDTEPAPASEEDQSASAA